MDTSGQVFSLKWNNYLSHIMDAFELLRSEENLVDVTLSCEGYKIKAHKMLLSACSSYFKDLFKDNPCKHPIVVFRNVKFYDLRALIDFIYQGEVNVMQDQLSSFLATAKFLEVKGLADNNFNSAYDKSSNLEPESFEDENFNEPKEEEEEDGDEENLSDASQYAQSTYQSESPSTPYQLSIIPINKNVPEPSPEYYASAKKKRKVENEEENYHQRRHFVSSAINKPMVAALTAAATAVARNAGSSSCGSPVVNELSSIGFKTKQSVEIFPVPVVKAEPVDEPYNADRSAASATKESTRIDRLPECEIQTMNVDIKPKIKDSAGATEDLYTKTHMELNHLLTKSSLAAADSEMPQDSLQGHWLSSLNNGGDGSSETVSNEAGVTMSNRKSVDANVDYSQQRHRYICNICGATYKHLRNLRAHCHLHYGKTRCNLCNKVLCNISYFKKHLQQQHGMLSTKKTDAKNVPSPAATLNSSS